MNLKVIRKAAKAAKELEKVSIPSNASPVVVASKRKRNRRRRGPQPPAMAVTVAKGRPLNVRIQSRSLGSAASGLTAVVPAQEAAMQDMINVAVTRKNLSAEVAAVMTQMMLPYTSPLVRVKSSSTGTNTTATATTRNFVTIKFDMKSLVDRSVIDTNFLPNYGNSSWGGEQPRQLYDQLGVYFPITHYYDPYVLGSYPIVNLSPSAGVYSSAYVFGPLVNNTTTWNSSLLYNAIPLDSAAAGNFRLKSNILGSPLYFLSPSTLLPQGATAQGEMPVITSQGVRWVWIDASNFVTNNLLVELLPPAAVVVPADTFSLIIFKLYGLEEADMEDGLRVAFPAAGAGSVSAASSSILSSGFYRFAIRQDAAGFAGSSFQVKVTVTYKTSIVTKFVLNDQLLMSSETSGAPMVDKVQLNGASLLVSNTTQAMGLGGYCFATQVLDTSDPFDLTSQVSRIVDQNPLVRYSGDWASGCYGFIKPNKAIVLRDFASLSNRNGGGIPYYNGYVGSCDPDLEDGLYGANIYLLAPTLSSDQTLYTVSAQLTFSVALEYTSQSQLVVLGHPVLPPTAIEEAMAAMADIDVPFSSNPIHIREMWAKLKSATSRVLSDMPGLALKASKMILPTMGPYGRLAAGALSLFS